MRHLLAMLLMAAGPLVALAADPIDDAWKDVRRLPPSVAQQVQYLDISIFPLAYREEALKVLAFQANQLSRESEIAAPRVVSANVIALNRDDYKWKRAVWDKFADIDPYYHVRIREEWPGGFDKRFGKDFKAGRYIVTAIAPWVDYQKAVELSALTGSKAPILRADWWFVQTARQLSLANKQTGVGYYDFLGVKKRADFEALVAFREADSLAIGKEIRAAVERSGVATQNRQIVRLQSLTGGYWVTLDTDNSEGKSNAIRNLGRGDFEHKAEEIYGTLPNGLFAYFLGDAQGNRQDSAPDFIGADDSPLRSGRDARIHVGLACVRCHSDGLRPIDDWARRNLRGPISLQSPDYAKLVELRRQYLSNLDGALSRDRAVYAESLRSCNGLTPAENARAYARFWDWYVLREREPAEVAEEFGTTEHRLLWSLRRAALASGQIDLVLSGLIQSPPTPLRIEHVEELAPVIHEYLRLYP